MAFDPDAYLAKTEPKITEPKNTAFDPDKFLSKDSDVPLLKTEKIDKAPTLKERAKDVGGTALISSALGAVAPEIITTAGMAASMFPLTAPAGPPLMMMGRSMRGQRLASAGAGLVSGTAEEIAGQTARDVFGASKPVEEITRFTAAAVAPEFSKALLKGIGYMIPVATKGTVNQAMNDVAKMFGTEEKVLTPSQRTFLEKIVNDIRGGKVANQPLVYSYNVLKEGTDNLISSYTQQVNFLEKQANDLMSGATQRSANLDRELSAGIQKLNQTAEMSARSVINTAEAKANAIRDRARTSSSNIGDVLEIDARQAIKQGQEQAQQILRDAQQRILKLRQQAGGQVVKSTRELGAAQQKIADIGTPLTETQSGEQIRNLLLPRFDLLKKTRDQKADANFSEAFNFALVKEQQGNTANKTQAFADFSKQVKDALTDPTTNLANVPEGAIKQQLTAISKALEPTTRKEVGGEVIEIPNDLLSFRGLETLRRVLRDRASGLPAEGADAISQSTARKLAEGVESVQREFSPSIETALKQYQNDSIPLNAFKTKLGQMIVGKEDFDMGRFVTNPASIAKSVFNNETAIKDIVSLSGVNPQSIENIARNYVVNILKNADAKKIQSFMQTNNDWLNERTLPKLFSELNTASQGLGRAETFGGARSTLAQTLRTEARNLPKVAETSALKREQELADVAQRLRTTGGKAGENILQQAEKQAEKVTSDALKQAENIAKSAEKQTTDVTKAVGKQQERVVSEAEKQANLLRKQQAPLTSQSEAIRKLILGDASPVRRMEEIILSGSPKLWEQVGPILTKDAQTQKMAVDAIKQIVANKASRSPAGAIDAWRKDIAPFAESSGLMTKAEINTLTSKIDELSSRLDISPQQKLSGIQEFIVRTTFRGLAAESARGLNFLINPLDALLGK
jgi:hypothetical protein